MKTGKKKIFQKIKKTPKGRFYYKYFFNVQDSYRY